MSHWRSCAIALGSIATTALAGPLTPPAGAPAPTNKTLQEVEPRTPLVGTTISQPGSYYLTDNLASSIAIQVSGVTLDLNGFTIGPTASDAIFYAGVPDARGIAIKNGFIDQSSADAIDAFNASMLVLDNVHIANCSGLGVVATNAIITNCSVTDGGNDAFLIFRRAVIDNCSAISCVGGFVIESGALSNCVASDSTSSGFDFGSVDNSTARTTTAINCVSDNSTGQGFESTDPAALTNCTATEGTFQGFFMGDGSTLTNCLAQNNGQHGFLSNDSNTYTGCFAIGNTFNGFDPGNGSSLTNCVARNNTSNGFTPGPNCTLNACTAEFNGSRGFSASNGCVFNGCAAGSNGTDGFAPGAGNTLRACVANSNTEDGYTLNSDCRISNCSADQNGGGAVGGAFAGIRGTSDTTIDSCTVTDNPTGIIAGSGALVIRCTAAGNGANYNMGTSDHGAIITPVGAFTETNAFANISY